MTGPFNQESVNKDLSYTVSSVSANVAEDFSSMLDLGAAKAEEVVALCLSMELETFSIIPSPSVSKTTYAFAL